MSEQSPNHVEIDLHLANPDLASYDYGTAVAAAALHATSSDALRTTFEKLPLTPVEQIATNGRLIEMLRHARIL